MEQIHSFEALSPLLSAQLGRGVVTNAYLSAADWQNEIASGSLQVQPFAHGLLLYRAREGYSLLNFYLHPPYSIPKPAVTGTIVTEYVLRARDAQNEPPILDALAAVGFLPQLTRVRLSARHAATQAPLHTRTAGTADAPEINTLLHECFHALTGCLPSEAALLRDLEDGLVTVSTDASGNIASLVHGARTRGGAEIRHLCTKADARGAGHAQAALDAFLAQFHGALQVWTATDNTPALSFYQKNGFVPDGFTSTVCIRH